MYGGLAKTKLATSILDASFGTIRQQLAYKGHWYRVHVAGVDWFYPSSKLCHECGYKHDGLTLSERRWTCPSCGCLLNRDVNAAKNIRREGLRLRGGAHRQGKRLWTRCETADGCGRGGSKNPTALAVRSVNRPR